MRRVDPKLYDQSYYLSDCNGYDCFKRTWGKQLEPMTAYFTKKIPMKPGLKILDLGCGRGELSLWAAGQGAEVWGIDYSSTAVKIAKKAALHNSASVRSKCHFSLMDAKHLRFADHFFAGVMSIEVIEHLYPEEQAIVLSEIFRVLRPGGFVFIHTAPSRWFNDFTYRYYCYPASTLIVSLWNLVLGKSYPSLPPWHHIRTASHRVMHVGEPDYFSLTKMITRAGFTGSVRSSNLTILKPVLSWKDTLFNFFIYLYPLSRYFPFNVLWGNDFYALLHKPA